MMTALTRRAVTGGVLALAAASARAAEWPARTITIMHGYPPGGPSDIIARIIADGLSKALGQSVIVESRPGASGTLAAAQVARAAPDGYMLLVIPSGHPAVAATFAKLPFRAVADFTMITLASTYPYVMAVPSATGIKSVADLVDLGRTRATPLVYGTPGSGSGPHLAIEAFALQTRIKVQHVPFRGSAPAVTELIAGRLDFMMDPPATMMEFIRNGRLRALAVSSAARYFALPETPTLAQAGVAGFDVSGWQGLVAPAGLPAPIVSRLNREVTRILKEPATIERLHAFGNEASPTSPDEFKQRIESDIAKWTAVVEQIHFVKI